MSKTKGKNNHRDKNMDIVPPIPFSFPRQICNVSFSPIQLCELS